MNGGPTLAKHQFPNIVCAWRSSTIFQMPVIWGGNTHAPVPGIQGRNQHRPGRTQARDITRHKSLSMHRPSLDQHLLPSNPQALTSPTPAVRRLQRSRLGPVPSTEVNELHHGMVDVVGGVRAQPRSGRTEMEERSTKRVVANGSTKQVMAHMNGPEKA